MPPADSSPSPIAGLSGSEHMSGVARCQFFSELAQHGDWAAFAQAWANPAERPPVEFWGKLRVSLRRAGPATPDAELARPGWGAVLDAFASDPEWMRQAVGLHKLWCEAPSDLFIGWGVAEMEMAALGALPDSAEEPRFRLAAWLAHRRATPREIQIASDWGLPALEWEDQMTIASLWGYAQWRSQWSDSKAEWLARSVQSARSFVENGLFGSEDARGEIAHALGAGSEEGEAPCVLGENDALSLLALLDAFPAESRAVFEDAAGAADAFAGRARRRLQELAESGGSPLIEQALARVEALILAQSLPGSPSAPRAENAAEAKKRSSVRL